MLKTTISQDKMNFIADEMEKLFKENNIFYLRNDTVFSTTEEDFDKIFEYQYKANEIAVEKGIITQEDLLKDVEQLFK